MPLGCSVPRSLNLHMRLSNAARDVKGKTRQGIPRKLTEDTGPI